MGSNSKHFGSDKSKSPKSVKNELPPQFPIPPVSLETVTPELSDSETQTLPQTTADSLIGRDSEPETVPVAPVTETSLGTDEISELEELETVIKTLFLGSHFSADLYDWLNLGDEYRIFSTEKNVWNSIEFNHATASVAGTPKYLDARHESIKLIHVPSDRRMTMTLLVKIVNPPQPIEIFLPNATQDEAYRHVLSAPNLVEVTLHDFALLPSGMTYNAQEHELLGMPLERTPDLRLNGSGLNPEGLSQPLVFRLSVLPNPQKLWKNLDSDMTDAHWKPDVDHGSLSSENLQLIWASKRGRSHAHEGRFRDDDGGVAKSPSGVWTIALVCDGKGSGEKSRRGSQLAVEIVLSELPRILDEETAEINVIPNWENQEEVAKFKLTSAEILTSLMSSVAAKVVKRIELEAQEYRKRIEEFDTTFLLSVFRQIDGRWLICSISVGDGGMTLISTLDRTAIPLMSVDSGQNAGQTLFLRVSEFPSMAAGDRTRLEIVDSFDFALLMTDGITDALLPLERDLGSFEACMDLMVDQIFPAVPELQTSALTDLEKSSRQLLDWLDYWVKGEHDDRTICIVKRVENNVNNHS